jgi:hypothetical protein
MNLSTRQRKLALWMSENFPRPSKRMVPHRFCVEVSAQNPDVSFEDILKAATELGWVDGDVVSVPLAPTEAEIALREAEASRKSKVATAGPEAKPGRERAKAKPLERSRWNRWMDRCLEANLGCGEMRLAVALAREILGFNALERRIPDRALRETPRIGHGVTFDRAVNGLVAKGLIEVEKGGRGPDNRTLYRLLL